MQINLQIEKFTMKGTVESPYSSRDEEAEPMVLSTLASLHLGRGLFSMKNLRSLDLKNLVVGEDFFTAMSELAPDSLVKYTLNLMHFKMFFFSSSF